MYKIRDETDPSKIYNKWLEYQRLPGRCPKTALLMFTHLRILQYWIKLEFQFIFLTFERKDQGAKIFLLLPELTSYMLQVTAWYRLELMWAILGLMASCQFSLLVGKSSGAFALHLAKELKGVCLTVFHPLTWWARIYLAMQTMLIQIRWLLLKKPSWAGSALFVIQFVNLYQS